MGHDRGRIRSGSPYEPVIGFSRAVVAGERVLVSGTGPIWPDGSCPDDARAQADRCFEIIGTALAQAGASLADVIRTRMYLVERADADAVGVSHKQAVGEAAPAATMILVAGFLDPRWRVEIEAEAVLPDARDGARA
jgi:enamine deaminase RidA (YjgF/YER057c/UK114 family)